MADPSQTSSVGEVLGGGASHQIKVGSGHYDRSSAVKLGLLWAKGTAMGPTMPHEAGLVIGWRSWETKAGPGQAAQHGCVLYGKEIEHICRDR